MPMTPGDPRVIMEARRTFDLMKTNLDSILRKHGHQARLRIVNETDTRSAATTPSRLKTSLTFETAHQTYCWSTDRGRSRVIKH